MNESKPLHRERLLDLHTETTVADPLHLDLSPEVPPTPRPKPEPSDPATDASSQP